MTDTTINMTHALLEKLAEYVMNEVPRRDEVPTKQEMNSRFEQVDRRFEQVDTRLNRLEDDLQETKKNVKSILNGMDNAVKELEIIRTEQTAFNAGLRRVEDRVEKLEKKSA